MKTLTAQTIYKAGIIMLLFIFTMGFKRVAAQNDKMVRLQGTIKELNDGDSVMLVRYRYQFLPSSRENEIVSYAIVKNNNFSFNIELIEKVERCRIVFPKRLTYLNWEGGILEKNHNLKINRKGNKLHFTDLGATLVAYSALLDSIYKSGITDLDWQGKNMENNKKIIVTAIENIKNAGRKTVRYNDPDFSILRLDKEIALLSILYTTADRNDQSSKEFIRKSDAELKKSYLNTIFNTTYVASIPSPSLNGLMRSRFGCLFPKNQDETKIQRDNAYLNYLKSSLRDPILAHSLVSFLYDHRNSDLLTADYIDHIIKDSDFTNYKDFIQSIKRFGPGTLLPEFTLTDTSGNDVWLSQFKGNVLVLDFWYTGCLACARTYKIVKPIIKDLEGKPVKLISISEDKIRNIWVKSIHSGLYTDPEHINLSAGKQGNSHPLFKYLQISGYPTIIIIDKEGKIIGSPRKLIADQGNDFKSKIQMALNSNL